MRRGFTLVEMLVATALVMLIMLLFADVFGAAVGTTTAQRGIANNDQKARSFTTVLRHDLAGRTYRASQQRGATREIVLGIQESPRGIVPLSPGDVVDPRQLGYLYISENDVNDDTDDVLQFTAQVVASTTETAPSPYYGRAQNLAGPPTSVDNPNQPERDDGIIGNGAATSRMAEITYFVRGGNLYRRVMLIRDRLTNDPPFDPQPTAGDDGTAGPFRFPPQYPPPPPAVGQPYFDQQYTMTGRSFYADWDFSGTRVQVLPDNGPAGPDPEIPAGPDTYRFQFHSAESLSNANGTSNTPLGIPWNRFGFYSRRFSNNAAVSRPVEYLFDSTNSPIAYIGRFTQEETSHTLFNWPGIESGPPSLSGLNIMLRQDLILSPISIVSVDANTNGAYDAGDIQLVGPRSGEDILLTHVEAFDVKVWDPGAGEWKDIGHNTVGLYRQNNPPGTNLNNANLNYGPGGLAGNRVYDTWHPSMGARPPFRALQVLPNYSNVRQFVWLPNDPSYAVGDVFFPDAFGADNAPGVAGTDDDGNGITDFSGSNPDLAEIDAPGSDDNFSIGFIATQVVGNSGPPPRTWPRQPGTPVSDGGVQWKCFDNRFGLDRIRITVRYRDVTTGQSRQVTLVHSLVD